MKPLPELKSEQDAIGRTVKIIGRIIPTTPEEERLEMLRMWNADAKSKAKPYTTESVLRARGGEYPRTSQIWKERQATR